MKKTFGLISAAVLSLAVLAPTLASAETVIVERHHGMRMHRDHGWHRDWHRHHHHGDRAVIIRR